MSPAETLEKQYLRYRRTKAPKDLAPVFLSLAPQLMGAARRAGLDQQGAEDAVQETFLAFIAGEEKFEAGRPVIPWVRGIALRQINAERRRQARLRAIFQGDDAAPAPAGLDDNAGFDPLERVELRRKIEGAIQTLSEANQEVVRAALFEGLTIEEISKRLKLSHTATSVRLHRGLRRIRKKLGERSSLALMALTIPKTGKALYASGLGGVSAGSAGLVAAALLGLVGGTVWFSQGLKSEPGDIAIGNDVAVGQAQPAELEAPNRAEVAPSEAEPAQRVALAVEENADLVAAPAAPKVSVGLVFAENGQPALAGAEVYSLRSNPEIVLPTSPLKAVARTTAGGRYSLDLSKLQDDSTPVLVVRLGREVGWVDVTEEELELGQLPDIHLRLDLDVSAVVKDELGRPLEGVSIAAFSDVARFIEPMGPVTDEFGFPMVSGYQHLFGAESDAQGRARIGGLFGAGSPGLLVVLTAKKPGYARGMLAYLLDGEEGLEAEFTLPSVASLRMEGSVLDEHGDPLAGVELRFRVRGEAPLSSAVVATSDALGGWEIPNHLLDEFPVFLAFDRDGFSREELVVIEPTELEGDSFLVQMRPAGSFSGVVRDAEGAPIEGADVTVATIRSIKRLITDKDGAFECQVSLDTDRSVTVVSAKEGRAAHSVRFASSRSTARLDVSIPEHDGWMGEFAAELAHGERWSEAHLIPDDVAGAIAPLEPSRLEGSVAYFADVPHGEWVLCGVAESGVAIVEVVAIGDALHQQATPGRIAVEATQAGVLDCVIDVDDRWPVLSGGLGQCQIVARHMGLPQTLPSSTFQTGVLSRNELYLETVVGGPMRLERLMPGTWQICATGPGWTTRSAEVLVEAGASSRVDLEPIAAATLDLELPTIARSCLLRFSIRRSAEDSWSVVGIPSVAIGAPDVLTIQIPEGRWLWRAQLEADSIGEDFSDLSPATYGTVTVDAKAPTSLQVLEGSLESP